MLEVPEPLSFRRVEGTKRPLPQIGLGVASHGQPLHAQELARLRALNLAHLRVDVNLAQPDFTGTLRRAASEARSLDVPLEAALFVSNAAEEELNALLAALAEIKPTVGRWLLFHAAERATTEPWIRLARTHLKRHDASIPVGSGTNIYFTELNRGRPPLALLDCVVYSLNPQVHAFDNASLVETLEAQASTVVSARQFCGDVPLAVSPVTLRPRFNADATGPVPEPAPGALPSPVDVRQMSLFGAGWTLGSIKYLAESGASSVTCYETTGWRGVMEVEGGSPLPEMFRSIPGAVFPLYHVLADVGAFAGGDVLPTISADTLRLEGLTLQKDGRTRTLLASFSPGPLEVVVRNLGAQVRVRLLDETSAEEALRAPEAFRAAPDERLTTSDGNLALTLRPYALVRIDSV
jgi:hypothetical protein